MVRKSGSTDGTLHCTSVGTSPDASQKRATLIGRRLQPIPCLEIMGDLSALRARGLRARQEAKECVAGYFSHIGELYNVHHFWGKCRRLGVPPIGLSNLWLLSTQNATSCLCFHWTNLCWSVDIFLCCAAVIRLQFLLQLLFSPVLLFPRLIRTSAISLNWSMRVDTVRLMGFSFISGVSCFSKGKWSKFELSAEWLLPSFCLRVLQQFCT